MSRRHESVFGNPDISVELAELHHMFVVVPADMAPNNIVNPSPAESGYILHLQTL